MNLQIYATFHKDYPYQEDCEWIHPVAASGFECPHIWLRDNTGENISALNKSFCELTTHFWVWKNMKSDYVGFYHYRRYLDFAPHPGSTELADLSHLTSKHQRDRLIDLLSFCDVVISQREALGESIDAQYHRYVKNNSWKNFLQLLVEAHPKYSNYIQYFDRISISTTRNIFVMAWPLFDAYMSEIIPVLKRLYDIEGISGHPHYDRYPGFISERFLGLWLLVNSIRHVEVPVAFVPPTKLTT